MCDVGQGSPSWQARMVPFMVAIVVAAGTFFASVAVWKFNDLEARMERQPSDPPAIIWVRPGVDLAFDQQIEVSTIIAKYNLERESIARRYTQARFIIEARLWTRFLGFITGMLLSLIGGAFVLGKLETTTTALSASSAAGALTLRSTSPGLFLAVLGTALMTLSITVSGTTETKDGAIYFASSSDAGTSGPTLPHAAANPANREEPRPRP